MDLDFSCLSVDSSNETHQCNTNYLGKPPIKHACLSIGSSINSNTAECNMDGKIETALCEFSGQSDTNSNKTPLDVPSVIPNVPLLASCQFNDFFGTSRVFGYGESVPYEDIMKPTLTVEPGFTVEHDCERLGRYKRRFLVSEMRVIEVMGRRPVVQRIAILQKYRSMNGKNLPTKFISKLIGYLKDCLIALCYTPAEFDAIELHRAMRGTDTDEDTIIEILCTRTNEQIRRIKNVYPKLFYGRDLEDDVNDDIEYPFKSIYIALLKANRDEFTFVDGNLVRRDVHGTFEQYGNREDQSNSNGNEEIQFGSTGNQRNPLDPSWTEKARYGREMLLYSGHEEDNAPRTQGVALMLSNVARNALAGCESHGFKFIKASLKTKKEGITMNIIQCYAPTNDSNDDIKYQFYERLQSIIEKCPSKDLTILMGDLNAKVGIRNTGYEDIMGRHGLGESNENEERFVNLCAFNKLVIRGTIFPHKRIHKATWISLDHTTDNQIIFASTKNSDGQWKIFMPILITRSYGHLRAVFNEYSLISERDLEEEMRGHSLNSILSIVRCIQNRPRYFAEKLVKATEYTEKDYGTIIRIIVSRCEVDLGRIMEEFLNLKGEPLYKCIECNSEYNGNDPSIEIKSIIDRNLWEGSPNNYKCLLLKLIMG
ncbi:unnamed protein product [Schistosoma margrebowiei]|uniref:Uncharacterized protein n=1 Tax=Schistosoma margrebowiei TaxID=48269 RepID=A0A183LRN2_9TREM|nr:unnamed protein product [Schistosoma margrebowiei]